MKNVEKKRHLAKTITWRIIASADTFLIAWVITGKFDWAGAIAGFGFGLFDTFVLADRSTTLAFIQLGTYEIPVKSEGIWQLEQQPRIDFVRLSVSF